MLAAIDIDKRALDVYAKNIQPSSVYCQSVSNLVRYALGQDDNEYFFAQEPELLPPLLDLKGRVDMLIGGPPCQGHSGFNNRSRRNDPRNSLYLSAVASGIGLGVSSLVLENVPEIRHSHLEVVNAATQLLEKEGYKVSDGVIATSAIGWPQLRKRHFLVASKFDLVKVEDLALEFGGECPGSADFLASLPKREDYLEIVPEYSEETLERIRFFEENSGVYDLPLSRRPECHKGGTTYKSVYGRMRPHEPVPTLTTGFLTLGRGRFMHPTEPRTLTLGEGAYVQGFPSWYDFGGEATKRQELTKWIGDAVPLPLGFVGCMSVLRGLLR